MSLGHARKSGPVVAGILAVLAVVLLSGSSVAQSDSNPKWDLFLGYQFLHPGATVPTGSDPSNPIPYNVPDMTPGLGAAVTYNFDRHFGLEFDFGQSWGSGNNGETTASVGPRFIWRTDSANYFLHGLIGLNRLGANGVNADSGIGSILGGGMDLPLSKKISWRLFEADYVWGHHNFSDFASPEFPGLRRPGINGARLRTGLVFSWGGAPPVAPTASCSVQPSEVLVGEPITATATASNFNPKHTVTYSWSGNGGQVSGKDTTANIDTTNAAPGSYTVTAHVTDPKGGKNNEASCSANYTVKPLPPKNPPTVSLSASPTTVITGGSVSVTATCASPDGASTSVANWTASSGTVSGSGSSATLSTAGVPAGTVTVGATCTDSRGLTGRATTEVAVQNPPPPPVNKVLEAKLSLHSVYFPTALPSPKDPNGGLLASQQKTLVELAADFQEYLKAKPDAHLILEGHADPRGSVEYNQALSERRVNRVKSFLVEHGVAEGLIETRGLGDQHNLTADEVKASVEQNPSLTAEERARTLRNMQTIILASNRRVDVRLSTTGEVSTRQFPFNAEDALTLIGGRTPVKKAAPVKKPAAKKK